MINPYGPAIAQVVSEQLDEILIATRAKPHWIGRREPPILSLRSEGVWRRAAIGFQSQYVLESPPIRAVSLTAQCQIVVKTDRHAGFARFGNERVHLICCQPLKILKEAHSFHMPAFEFSHSSRRRHTILLWPIGPDNRTRLNE